MGLFKRVRKEKVTKVVWINSKLRIVPEFTALRWISDLRVRLGQIGDYIREENTLKVVSVSLYASIKRVCWE